MPSDDLLDHAKSDIDFYALLGQDVHPGSSEKDISRAYRRTALKHHPDKNKDDPNAVAKFHSLQIAYDVLSDPDAKAAYDAARAAREARRMQTEKLEGRRKDLVAELERREGGHLKRRREEADAEEALEREIKRLAEDGRRRRKEREDALRKEAEFEIQEEKKVEEQGERVSLPVGGNAVPEISRTIKVRWHREGRGADIDKGNLATLFALFGKIESVVVLKDRKIRLQEGSKKRLMGTGVIVYSSIVGAHAAVEDTKKQVDGDWRLFETVEWAEGKEPDFDIPQQSNPYHSSKGIPNPPSTPSTSSKPRFPGLNSTTATPSPSHSRADGGDGLRKVPSFASFSGKFGSSASSPFAARNTPNSPSLEEITLIRLKNAEKKRLEDQIRKEEATALEKD